MFSGEGELKNVLKYLYIGIFGFMWELIRVVQCWSSARRRARSCGFVKPSSQCKCAFLCCVRDVFVVACLRLRCDVVDARPWRACSRVRSRFEVSLEYLVVEILSLLWEKLRVVQGFVLIVIPKLCARSCGFVKSFNSCSCVSMLRGSFACSTLVLVMRRC